MPLSDYVESLDAVAKSRYFDKLGVLRLAATDDPYASGDFQDTMGLWPPVEFGHIFCYFIERPGVYTQQELLQWKQLDAYNYFRSGFVRDGEGLGSQEQQPVRYPERSGEPQHAHPR